jgi:hypothetical protein
LETAVDAELAFDTLDGLEDLDALENTDMFMWKNLAK